jgi:hypothetical protein
MGSLELCDNTREALGETLCGFHISEFGPLIRTVHICSNVDMFLVGTAFLGCQLVRGNVGVTQGKLVQSQSLQNGHWWVCRGK